MSIYLFVIIFTKKINLKMNEDIRNVIKIKNMNIGNLIFNLTNDDKKKVRNLEKLNKNINNVNSSLV